VGHRPEPVTAQAGQRINGQRATGGSGRSGKGKRRAARPGRKLLSFDRGLGVRFVAGADEAGRGCLAGPLVAAAVLLDLERIGPAQARALGALNDSKQQTAEARAKLYPVIMEIAARACIVSRCAPGIDARGLHRTNLQALRDALARVAVPGCICLSDGFRVADLGYEQRAVVGGDAKSAAIAAASVLAKETRDRYMRRATPAGSSPSTSATRLRNTVRRSSASVCRRCTGCRSSRPLISNSSSSDPLIGWGAPG
jgi:ribonuclease HII